MTLLALDGPATYGALSVTTTPIEVKVGGSTLDERKIITVRPVDGNVWYGYDNSVTDSTGTPIIEGQFFHLEAGPELSVYLVTDSGTVDVRITEVG